MAIVTDNQWDDLKTFVKAIADTMSGARSPALTSYVNNVNVTGIVYVEREVAADDIIIPLLGVLNQMYVCWILCALGLDTVCADGRTVRDRMQLVAGQQMLEEDFLDSISKNFGKKALPAPSVEADTVIQSGDPQTQRLITGRLVEFDFNSGVAETTTTTRPGEVETRVTNSPARSLKAYFYVILYPYFIERDIAQKFMQINFSPSLSSRWAQVKAKEISFWKDFVFCRDMIEKETKLLKNDKSGMVAAMMQRQRSGVFQFLLRKTGLLPDSHNLNNAILIFSDKSFDMACSAVGVNFNDPATRHKFFYKTFTMVVAVVSVDYATVKLYFAGVNNVGNYTFDMVNKLGSGKNDNFDLKTILSAFAGGQSPKF